MCIKRLVLSFISRLSLLYWSWCFDRTFQGRGQLYTGYPPLPTFSYRLFVASKLMPSQRKFFFSSPFLTHGWRSHAMGFWRHSNGTRMALDHSLTHSIFINLFIKVILNTLLLPPLLSITFVSSSSYAYIWNILEGTSKANFFPDTLIIEMGFVFKWKYSIKSDCP